MFVSHCRYNVFRKQTTIDACTKGFKELEAFGFEFGEVGYGGTHVHGMVNIPKRYSFQEAEIMLKNRSAQRIFAEKPNFRKLYPDGHFWSGYEHHQSVGKDMEASKAYIKGQQAHHGVKVINDTQKTLKHFTN
jgi:REP element-mobilizing transposase RayT